jgi:hypothetical protein
VSPGNAATRPSIVATLVALGDGEFVFGFRFSAT